MMDTGDFRFTINETSEADISGHLLTCNDAFIPPLDQKVDIAAYARKIRAHAVTFEAWHENRLIGLVAVYCNDPGNDKTAYITNVSALAGFRGKGLASRLLSDGIRYARVHAFREICLDVNARNREAVTLYKKFGFEVFEKKDDFYKMKLRLHE